MSILSNKFCSMQACSGLLKGSALSCNPMKYHIMPSPALPSPAQPSALQFSESLTMILLPFLLVLVLEISLSLSLPSVPRHQAG